MYCNAQEYIIVKAFDSMIYLFFLVQLEALEYR